MTPQELQTQAIQLPIAERWRLVQTLLASIQQETQPVVPPANEHLTETEIDAAIAHLHPWTQSLIGILPTTSEDLQEAYIDSLEEKYA